MITLSEFIDSKGNSPFAQWFDELNSESAAKITTALYKLERGNFSKVEGVGGGVFEHKLNFGPGYRIYFGKDGEQLVILLAGGTKKRQTHDIKNAKQRWQEYKQRKRNGEM